VPVNKGFGWIDEVSSGRLRGAELHLAQYQQSGLGKEAGNVTGNVVLWPKMYVLTMSQKKFDALSDQQRAWIREAANRGVRASVEADYDESSIAQELCTRGVRFKDATPAQLLGLRTQLAPVLDRLATDPLNGPLLTKIKAVAAEYPAGEPLKVDSDCRKGASVSDLSAGAVPRTTAAIPDGVYRVQISTDEVLAAGLDNHDGTSGTWTMSVRRGRSRCGVSLSLLRARIAVAQPKANLSSGVHFEARPTSFTSSLITASRLSRCGGRSSRANCASAILT
jgi:Bacterial extracellular solute-binding protein, family 7